MMRGEEGDQRHLMMDVLRAMRPEVLASMQSNDMALLVEAAYVGNAAMVEVCFEWLFSRFTAPRTRRRCCRWASTPTSTVRHEV